VPLTGLQATNLARRRWPVRRKSRQESRGRSPSTQAQLYSHAASVLGELLVGARTRLRNYAMAGLYGMRGHSGNGRIALARPSSRRSSYRGQDSRGVCPPVGCQPTGGPRGDCLRRPCGVIEGLGSGRSGERCEGPVVDGVSQLHASSVAGEDDPLGAGRPGNRRRAGAVLRHLAVAHTDSAHRRIRRAPGR
jgi:hypothetical protein